MKHADAIKRICFSCFKRVQPEENILSSSLLHDRVKRLLPFVFTSDLFPTGICSTCRRRLAKFETGERTSFELKNLEELNETLKRTSPRNECKCKVCEAAGATGLGSRVSVKRGRPKQEDDEEDGMANFRCCPKCFSQIYRGCVHECNNTTLLNNILSRVPENVQQRVASTVVKAAAAENGSKQVSLRTGGTPLTVTIGPAEKKEKLRISHEAMDDLQDGLGLSNAQTLKG